jgi:hypothetical protein
MARLTAIVRPQAEIDAARRERMYALYATYYDAVTPERFRSDLEDKDFVIELREQDELRGFSTVALMDFDACGARRAIFSGDTIVDRRCWGEQSLARAFCRLAGNLKALAPRIPLYWFLISKGHRTYRYLSAFSRVYYPSPHLPTPPEAQAWLDELATRRFGAAYVPELGLVRFPSSHGYLKPDWAGIHRGALERPEVRFFSERNPRHSEGDELCCITALEASNLRSFARREFLEGVHEANPVWVLPGDLRSRRPLSQPADACAGDAATVAADPAAT